MPLLYGKLADLLGPLAVDNFKQLSEEVQRQIVYDGRHQSYLMVIPCYLFIMYNAFWGHKIGRTKKA